MVKMSRVHEFIANLVDGGRSLRKWSAALREDAAGRCFLNGLADAYEQDAAECADYDAMREKRKAAINLAAAAELGNILGVDVRLPVEEYVRQVRAQIKHFRKSEGEPEPKKWRPEKGDRVVIVGCSLSKAARRCRAAVGKSGYVRDEEVNGRFAVRTDDGARLLFPLQDLRPETREDREARAREIKRDLINTSGRKFRVIKRPHNDAAFFAGMTVTATDTQPENELKIRASWQHTGRGIQFNEFYAWNLVPLPAEPVGDDKQTPDGIARELARVDLLKRLEAIKGADLLKIIDKDKFREYMASWNGKPVDLPGGLKVVSVDFDGVIHSYSSGWRGPRCIPDPPVPGAFDFLRRLLGFPVDAGHPHGYAPPLYRVAIFSSRSRYWFARRAMRRWFALNGLEAWYLRLLEFPLRKPPAHL
jgi:hypothetical protein